MEYYRLINDDCITAMKSMDDASIDAIVTDPPYELGFMGKSWDKSGVANNPDMWREALRVLKPGGHLLAFSGARTYHRMTCAIEDAGFEVRDQIMWIYGSGFPKSLDVSKAIDKAAGAVREVIGRSAHAANRTLPEGYDGWTGSDDRNITAPATAATQQWQGWGTALKPAHEPICVARKPLAKGCTVAANVLLHGTGGVNIDGCRVGTEERLNGSRNPSANAGIIYGADKGGAYAQNDLGRWPANLIHDGSEEVLAGFPDSKGQQGDLNATGRTRPSSGRFGDMAAPLAHKARIEDDKSAARFFYCAKASKADRDDGNTHPTVKPHDLMRYLCRLITPPGGVILDPFMGSGSTGKAAVSEGFRFVGIDMTAEYVTIAEARIKHALTAANDNEPAPEPDLLSGLA